MKCTSPHLVPYIKYNDGSKKLDFASNIGLSSDNLLNDNIRLARSWYARQKGKPYLIDVLEIPCGHCVECLKLRSKAWAFRNYFEALNSQGYGNYFITFTYDDEHLPKCLVKDEISKFNKKLKMYLKRKGLYSEFRFYMCGEYGGKTLRPHYHVLYYDLPLDDLEFYSKSDSGGILWNSQFLNKLWQKGFVVVGDMSFNSAAYVSRYVDKKIDRTNEQKENLLKYGIQPEFNNMSRKPGIGSCLQDEYDEYILDTGLIPPGKYINGCLVPYPKYYYKKFKEEYPDIVLKNDNLNVIIDLYNTELDARSIGSLDAYLSEKNKLAREKKESKLERRL